MKFPLAVSALALATAWAVAPAAAQTPPPAAQAATDAAPLRQPGRWAQDYLGRPADPAVRFGTLPNGLRYAIMANHTPADGVSMRMRIGSGSLKERDEEQGLAHYLEHMAFRGSAHVADGEVVRMLERQGLRFGADTNAFTVHDETVYQFDFPHADASALGTGLTLFREIGGALSLSPAAVEAERGVILSEERLRDVPAYEALKANFGNALAGNPAVSRWPIGTIAAIKAATPERLRRFYEANYRPENATLVVVGNIDPAQVEAEIKARFADWRSPASPADAAPASPPPRPAAPASEYVAPGAPDALSLSWVRAEDRRAETAAFDREMLTRQVGLAIFNNRLADLAARPGSPFVGAQAGELPSLFGAAALTQIHISAAPAAWRAALAAVVEAQRQLLAQPITAADMARALAEIRTELASAAANAPTRTNADLANAIVTVTNDDQIYTSPAQDLAFAEPVLAALTPADVHAGLERAFAGAGPVLFRSAQKDPATPAALAAQLAAAYASPLATRAAQAAISWPYDHFGAPAAITEQHEDKELGATLVRFANGSRLIVKPTAFEKDRISVSVALGSGRAGAPAALTHALWATQFATIGGTGKLSAGDLARWAETQGRQVAAQAQASTHAFVLGATTRPADFTTEMQLLAAYARDPGFRPELADKLAAIAPMVSGQLAANAGATFSRAAQRLLKGDDARYGELPTAPEIAATRAADLPALLGPALAGPADVTVVGDISVAAAISAMQATFAAGPARPAQPQPPAVAHMTAPRAEPFIVTHEGRADQAYYGRFWPLPDYFADPQLSYTADVASAVLQARLIDTVREKLGLTYSPQTQAVSSADMAGLGYLGVMLETPPANFATFAGLLDGQIAELASRPVTPDELERARRPLVEAAAKALEQNAYWARQLPQVLRDPRLKAPTLEAGRRLAQVSAADVTALFARFVAGKTPLTLISQAKP